ncbi:MAG TPA: TIGR03768 family metallophosphoesterase [Kiritimatiellia bacterium]|nr:TIGR03768 family metallophosphoesterase [Kiritimatiellia bacterium]HPS08106.1 TIGR03768 family metallophosphoesterase [Kiritimatiellia bacterium]
MKRGVAHRNGVRQGVGLGGLFGLVALQVCGAGVEIGTRQRTLVPVELPEYTPIAPSNVAAYVDYGYAQWQWEAGTNHGVRLDLMPADYAMASRRTRLLSFFTISDIHITDKESPAQVPYYGWGAEFGDPGLGSLNPSSYSPAMCATTHLLDSTVQTINALHRLAPFHFGIALGDFCNSGQYNELRWFIDVMDGKNIQPSSGAHLGADTIDYQKPYKAAGLDRSIPWYAAIGNHDQFWMGIGYPTEKVRQALVSSNVLEITDAVAGPLWPNASEGQGTYVGVVDGTTKYGDVIYWGATNGYETTPTVAPDPNRHIITENIASPTNFIAEFFNTTSEPVGHGFIRDGAGSTAACYTFQPMSNAPIRVIVLDNTCKSDQANEDAMFYGGGWMDDARYAWLTNELQRGQNDEQLMILAAHVPVNPQESLLSTNKLVGIQFYDEAVETNLIATLHRYPNLLMLMTGHRHVSVVTPYPSPDPTHPELGFWQVETPSLRDFPIQFRSWEIFLNSDTNISIVTTDVDPETTPDSPAGKAVSLGLGALRVYSSIELTNTYSHAYNAELVKLLTPEMQAKLAGCGETQWRRVSIDSGVDGLEVGFLGRLQSTDSLVAPLWAEVSDATNSPHRVSAQSSPQFFRAVKE